MTEELTPEELTTRALQHAAFSIMGGPEVPPVCVLCGEVSPDASGEYGSFVYYCGPPTNVGNQEDYVGFHCNKCRNPLRGLSGCEHCSMPLGPLQAVTSSSEEEGVSLMFHEYCFYPNRIVHEEAGWVWEKETWREMLARWAEDLEDNGMMTDQEKPYNPKLVDEVAALIRTKFQDQAQKAALEYEQLGNDIRDYLSRHSSGEASFRPEEWADDEIDAAIKNYIFWWIWGN